MSVRVCTCAQRVTGLHMDIQVSVLRYGTRVCSELTPGKDCVFLAVCICVYMYSYVKGPNTVFMCMCRYRFRCTCPIGGKCELYGDVG